MRYFITVLLLSITINSFAQMRVTLYNSNNQPERVAVIRYLLDAFELYNKDIVVDIISYNDDESIEEILKKDTPDIILADTRLLYRLDKKELLDNQLTEKIIDNLGREDFYKGSLNIGVPYSAWLQVLWYRSDWFKDAGLNTPNTLYTLQNAVNYFSKLNDKYGVIIGSVNEVYTEQCFLHIARANGLNIESSENSSWLDKHTLLSSLDIYKNLLKSSPTTESSWRSRDFYFQNKSSMLFYSTHLMDDLAIKEISLDSLSSKNFSELNGTEYDPHLIKNTGMITTITGVQSVSYGSVSSFGIFKSDDENRIDAKERLINFLFQDDVYITWLHMSPGGMLPVKKSILKNDNFFRDPSGVFRRFGRDKIIELTEGIEHLKVMNLEELWTNTDYMDNGLLKLIYKMLNSKIDEQEINYSWIKES